MGADGELFQLDPSDPKAFTRSLGGGLPSINAFGITPDGTIVAPAGGLATPGSAVAITIVAVKEDPTGDKTVEPIVEDLPGVAGGATDAEGNPYVLANVTGEVIAIDRGGQDLGGGPDGDAGRPVRQPGVRRRRDALPVELHRAHDHRGVPRRHRARHHHRRLIRGCGRERARRRVAAAGSADHTMSVPQWQRSTVRRPVGPRSIETTRRGPSSILDWQVGHQGANMV